MKFNLPLGDLRYSSMNVKGVTHGNSLTDSERLWLKISKRV